MSKYEEELIIKYGKVLEERNILKRQLDDAKNQIKSRGFDRILFSAMLTDITTALYGRSASRDTPKFLLNIHAGWVCGPGGAKESECTVEAAYRINKQMSDAEWIREWKLFLLLLGLKPRKE